MRFFITNRTKPYRRRTNDDATPSVVAYWLRIIIIIIQYDDSSASQTEPYRRRTNDDACPSFASPSIHHPSHNEYNNKTNNTQQSAFFYSTLQLFSLSFPKWTASDEQQLQQQQQQHGRSHNRSNDCGSVTMIPCNVATTTCRFTIQSSTFTPHHQPSHNDNNNNRMMTRHDDTLQCRFTIRHQPSTVAQ